MIATCETTQSVEEPTNEAVRRFVLEATKERVAYLKYIKSKGYPVDDDEIARFEEEIRVEASKLDEELKCIDEQSVSELQRELAYVEVDENHTSQAIKAVLYQLQYIKLRMRPEQNHKRPHFHIEYKRQYSASYALDGLERLAGDMPKKYEEPILKWAAERPLSLTYTWERLAAGEDVRELIVVPPERR